MSFESFSTDQGDNNRSTVFGSRSTVFSQAMSTESRISVDGHADQQSSNLSVGKKRYRTEELPRAGVMKPKTPGEGEPRDGGKANPPAGNRSKGDNKKGGSKGSDKGKGGSGGNIQSKGGKGNVKKSL